MIREGITKCSDISDGVAVHNIQRMFRDRMTKWSEKDFKDEITECSEQELLIFGEGITKCSEIKY